MPIIPLSPMQQGIVELDGNVLVTACPGSGKTRVLTAKALVAASELKSRLRKIAAVTFTNRASDEIRERLRDVGYSGNQVWTGTIHSFALEWIVRPYSCYDIRLRNGFTVADEFYCRSLIDGLRSKYNIPRFQEPCTAVRRNGDLEAKAENERLLVTEYRESLEGSRLLDFDMILYHAFNLLSNRPEIAKTLSTIFHLICIDEYQDTQDLQYGILSSITRANSGLSNVFIVGDSNQAIYSSLGSITKDATAIKKEFGLSQLHCVQLVGNYRSTQRIVELCSHLTAGVQQVESLSEHAATRGIITYSNQQHHFSELPEQIGSIVRFHLISGVQDAEICILAPTWQFAIALSRELSTILPEVSFDAPGLSPIKYQPDSVWFQLARLFLTEPHPSRYSSRIKWASELISNFEADLGRELESSYRSPRNILRACNSIKIDEDDGIRYLSVAFSAFTSVVNITREAHTSLFASMDSFLAGAKSRIECANGMAADVGSMKRMFRYPSGVVVNSCHGVKGEEFDVVICFGLLRGRIPHWDRIFDPSVDDSLEARKMLYVICSRAKRHLHLFSEHGRTHRSGSLYATTRELAQVMFDYDELKSFI